MMAGRRCLSFSSIAPFTAATREDHHSSGSCSAQPGRGCSSVYCRSLKTSGVPSGSKIPTLAPPVPKSMPRRYGPSAITVLLSPARPAWRVAANLSSILPAELIPQIARDELIYPPQGVVRQVLLWLPGQVHYRLQQDGIRLADVDLALGTCTRLYGRDDRGRVRLAPATGKRTVTVRVRGDEHRPLVEPDGVEGDLELAIVEPAVVASDHYVDLLWVLRHPDPGFRERVLERLLAYREDRCFRVIPKQPPGHGDDGVYYLGGWCLQAKLAEFLRVHPRVFCGVVGEEDHTLAELAQLQDQTLRAGKQLVSQVDGPVEIEDVAFVEAVRRLRRA